MLKVTVISSDVRHQEGIGKASGKPYSMDFQVAYAHTFDKKSGKPNPFPEKIELTLEKDERGNPAVYAPGDYELHPSSLYVGQYGLEVAPRLVPLKKA